MSTIIIFALLVVAALLFAMWLSPKFKETVAAKWGWIGVALLALATWIGSWFSGSPPELPPL